MVKFLLDGEIVTLENPDPTGTVLDWLRYERRRTGTKEGCAEGDCGACTVLLGELDGESVQWRAVNACILFLPMLDGKALLTVESLGGDHPVQREMVERHGSQCGFCTPGFIMSLYGRSIGALGSEQALPDVLSGNLCRCTGYGPILAAGEAVKFAPRDDAETVAALKTLGRDRAFAPQSVDGLAALLLEHPEARIVAGATDVGLWVTKQLRVLERLVFIGDIPELRVIEETEEGLRLGAAVRYTEAAPALTKLHPALGELVRRIGGTQVRNAGTIGGNIANGSPIGDTPPAFIALGARLTLRRGNTRREIPLEDFFIAYGKQDRAPGEFVESILIPWPDDKVIFSVTKLSKRFDSDISAVCGAFAVTVEDGVVKEARIAFGGMAGTPKRAIAAEAALTGKAWNEAAVENAAAALVLDYAPLSDMRGSSAYRLEAAGNLLRRLFLAQGGETVSVLELTHG